jgi:threonine 3-dehydrogenase
MKALVKRLAEPGLWLEEVPEPEVGVNDVLIRIRNSSICGTDLHIYEWDAWARKHVTVPLVIGHEFAGTVERVGELVNDFFPGDVVSGEGHLVCGHCRNCLAGRRHLCAHTSSVGVNRPGCFAELLCIPVANVWHADPRIPLEVLSCFDPLGNATHSALSFDVLGEDVLITGAGPIGIMAAAIVRHAGARFVVVSDPNPYRLQLARRMGATLTVQVPGQSIGETQKQLGMKEGFDVGLEMSGSPEALNEMLRNMCHGGKVALLGILPAGTGVDWDLVIFNGLTLKGIYGREMYETWYKMTMLIQTGLDITPIITHRLHYTEFEKGFEVMRSGLAGKVVLDWTVAS